jgi:hypothetical protein
MREGKKMKALDKKLNAIHKSKRSIWRHCAEHRLIHHFRRPRNDDGTPVEGIELERALSLRRAALGGWCPPSQAYYRLDRPFGNKA